MRWNWEIFGIFADFLINQLIGSVLFERSQSYVVYTAKVNFRFGREMTT